MQLGSLFACVICILCGKATTKYGRDVFDWSQFLLVFAILLTICDGCGVESIPANFVDEGGLDELVI